MSRAMVFLLLLLEGICLSHAAGDTENRVTIENNGDCNLVIGVNKSTVPDSFECIITFFQRIRDAGKLDSIDLDKPFTYIGFWTNFYDGYPRIDHRDTNARLNHALVLITGEHEVDFSVNVHLHQAFKSRYTLTDHLIEYFDTDRYSTREEGWVYQHASLHVKKQVFIPHGIADAVYIHTSYCNFTLQQIEEYREYFAGNFLKKPEAASYYPCRVEPYNGMADWKAENFAPLISNGFGIESKATTAQIIEQISRGRLQATIEYRNAGEGTMFDLENMFEYAEFVFRFRQENVTKQCSSALLVRMHPHYRLLPDGGGVRVSLSEIDNITYEECETNPF